MKSILSLLYKKLTKNDKTISEEYSSGAPIQTKRLY